MTMHPDPHAPHPCRAFDDPALTIPPPPAGRMAISPPEPSITARAILIGIAETLVFSFSMAAILLAVFFLFGG